MPNYYSNIMLMCFHIEHIEELHRVKIVINHIVNARQAYFVP